MQNQSVQVRETAIGDAVAGRRFEGVVFTGPGREVVERIARETGQDGAAVLDAIVRRLLVKKGADWTSAILSDYLGLYEGSACTFALVWDKAARQLAAHGAVFQAAAESGGAGLVAHIRTDDAYRRLGLGTLVTEEVTRAAFERGARAVVLGTDDKLHRIQQGEKAAHSMYSKLGYAILAQRELADTVAWLMVVDPAIFERCQQAKQAAGGRLSKTVSQEIHDLQKSLIDDIREQFSRPGEKGDSPHLPERPGDCPDFRDSENGTVPFGQGGTVPLFRTSPVGLGDLANLFLLLNLCPPEDFQLKLASWGIHLGPEMERSFVVGVRPALADRDRLEDASMALRDRRGLVVAVVAARQAAPFTRNTMEVDFYCLPRFLENNRPAIVGLVASALRRIEQSDARPSPCRLLFSGVDRAKIELFQQLGFAPAGNGHPYFTPAGETAFHARQYEKLL